MSPDWLKDVDMYITEQGGNSDTTPRNLNEIEAKRMDYMSKLAQGQAAEIDLLIAEAYATHDKTQATLKDGDLDENEIAAIKQAKNRLELTNARLKVLIAGMRRDCNVPYNAKLRGTSWYDDSTGKIVPIVPTEPREA